MSKRSLDITPDLMLRAYRAGLFPMAETRAAEHLHWLDPDRRGIIPLDTFHAPTRLLRALRATPFTLTANIAFAATIQACATTRPETWINPQIERLFQSLHQTGQAHSIECWHGAQLVGGLYGVAIGGAFFGESMFSRARDASKFALLHLVARLRLAHFSLLDTQFVTPHLAQFGAIEIARAHYKTLLAHALQQPCHFPAIPDPTALATALHQLGATTLTR